MITSHTFISESDRRQTGEYSRDHQLRHLVTSEYVT